MTASGPPSADAGKHAVARVDKKLAELQVTLVEAFDAIAMTDYLTGLGNQLALQKWLEGVVATEKSFSVAFIEVDRFKKVNDDFGYPDADRLLQAIGEVLRNAQNERPDSIAFRAHGDEFYLGVSHRVEDEEALDFHAVVDGIRARIAKLRVTRNDDEMSCTASCGWFSPSLLAEGDTYSALSVQTYLQTAVMEAKRSRNATVKYAPALDKRRLETARLDCGDCKIKLALDFDPDVHRWSGVECPFCKKSLAR